MLTKHKSNVLYRLISCSNLCKTTRSCRVFSSTTEEQREIPYPQIDDVSPSAVKKREKLALHEKYRKLNTVEEKLFALNFARYYGWETTVIKEGEIPYNLLPFAKYATRTHFTEVSDVPVKSSAPDIDAKDFVSVIKSQIQEAILFENFERRHRHELEEDDNGYGDITNDINTKDLKLRSILNQINRILILNLAQYAPHLIQAEVDYDPRIEAFWQVGGFKRSPEEHKIRTEKLERDDIPFAWKEEDGDEIEHWFQYFGETLIQLRSELPLEPVINDVNKCDINIADLISVDNRTSPAFYGFEKKRRFGTSIPGFFPAKKTNEFGLLSFHSSNHLSVRPPHFTQDEHNDAVHAQALLAAYAWLHGLASYQGFSTFNEISYPLVSQHVITNGQSFSFYVYQLNTLLMHKEFFDNNKRCNRCYGTKQLKLYEDIKGREFIGWNDDVLLRLISMYMNKTSQRNYNMKPNVNENERYISEITDIDERRVWLHNQFRHMYSNRPRSQLPYEIFDWEWIYKVKFMTRLMDARRRPFEVWQHPLDQRKYNDYQSHYIPKHMKYPDKPKQKNYNTYFPDAF